MKHRSIPRRILAAAVCFFIGVPIGLVLFVFTPFKLAAAAWRGE